MLVSSSSMKEHILGDKWIHWPVLPMKNFMRRQENSFPLLGIVVAGKLNVIYEINLWELHDGLLWPQLKDVKKWEYASTEEMLADGWEVD